MRPIHRPPPFVRAVVAFVLSLTSSAETREVVLGDLDEDFHEQLEARVSRRAARRRYWTLAAASVGAIGRHRLWPDNQDREPGEMRRFTFGDRMWQDIRHGVRLLGRNPGFTAASVFTLALGIGANTAIATVAWNAILKPLPYPNADRLVTVWESFMKGGGVNTVMPANFRDWRRDGQSFEALAAYGYFRGTWDLTAQGEPEQWRIRQVTGPYFEVFGMPALLGRTLTAADTARPTVVLSEGSWRRRFAGDPAVVGREIRLNDRATLVAGVMPAAFELAAGRVDAWSVFDLPPDPPGQRLSAHYLGVVGRLKPGISLEHADAEVRAIAARAADEFPRENGQLSATVRSIQGERGATVRDGLAILALAAAAVLLIACANLGSLQFSRTAARAREFGIRAAIGATRGRLVSQLLTEGLVIAVIGGGVGLLLGRWLLAALATTSPAAVRYAATASLDPAVILFATALVVLSALAFALWPAWRAGARAPSWLGRRSDTGDRRTRAIRASLVTVQITLAAMLLVTASTLIASLRNVMAVDPGFDRTGVLSFDVSLQRATAAVGRPPGGAPDEFEARQAMLDSILTEVRGVPGVTAACAINEIPFDAPGNMTYVPDGQDQPVGASPRNVTPGCLELLRIRLVRGRLFSDPEPARAAIVSASFAERAWPGQDPIGRRVHVGVKEGDLIEVVGVVADTRQASLEDRPYPQLYEAAVKGSSFWPQRVLVRASGRPEPLFGPIRDAVRRVDPDQPVANLRTLDDVVSATVAGRRFDLSLTSGFSAIALVLAAIGIYGLLSQTVTQRSREIGVRLALGATPGSVVRLVMRMAWTCLAIGLATGISGAVAASTLLRKFVFGISPTEPWLYFGVFFGVAALALGAAWLAARRAARLDPLTTLRAD